MALTITQEPTSPNMANADLLYVVESPTTSSFPSYQFVLDVYESGSSDRLQRVKQQPNPSSYGVFNIGQIVSQYLEMDNVWKIDAFATSSECNKQFEVKFGEEYALSNSSSVNLYDGEGSLGNPALTSSANYVISNGLVDFPNGHNFPSASYYANEDATDDVSFTHAFALTNAPKTQSIQTDEYATIALYNGNADGIDDNQYAQDVAYLQIERFDSAGVSLGRDRILNTTLRSVEADLWTSVYNTQTNKTRLVHAPVGYQNLLDNGLDMSDVAYYTATFYAQATDSLPNEDGVWDSFRFNVVDADCSYDGVRFAWKNEFGVWDYYTFSLQSSANSTIVRDSYRQTLVDFSTENSAVNLQSTQRGATQFYNEVSRDKTANSNWLTQAEADWLRELFYSTDVYIQSGSDFYPAVITSANFIEKTNPRTQKQFQYQLAFRDANQPRPRI